MVSNSSERASQIFDLDLRLKVCCRIERAKTFERRVIRLPESAGAAFNQAFFTSEILVDCAV